MLPAAVASVQMLMLMRMLALESAFVPMAEMPVAVRQFVIAVAVAATAVVDVIVAAPIAVEQPNAVAVLPIQSFHDAAVRNRIFDRLPNCWPRYSSMVGHLTIPDVDFVH